MQECVTYLDGMQSLPCRHWSGSGRPGKFADHHESIHPIPSSSNVQSRPGLVWAVIKPCKAEIKPLWQIDRRFGVRNAWADRRHIRKLMPRVRQGLRSVVYEYLAALPGYWSRVCRVTTESFWRCNVWNFGDRKESISSLDPRPFSAFPTSQPCWRSGLLCGK